MVTIQVIRLLLEAADCVKKGCTDSEVAPATREWLSFLVRSRLLYVMPMTNAIGYDHDTR